MIDQYNRTIDYLRISITDRCNLRCSYCMPDGIQCTSHQDILRYEEILQICKVAVSLGITNFKITGGEPLVRLEVVDFIRQLKALEGVNTVTLTTNGVFLAHHIKELKNAGIDAINISLDTMDEKKYKQITGFDVLKQVKAGILASVESGIRTKINCVLLEEYKDSIVSLSRLARDYDIDVRYIELMPIGVGKNGGGISQRKARSYLLEEYPDLQEETKYRGNGPARYETSTRLKGKIGWIDAMSHIFCESCNRVRLTSTGMLKPCLCYGDGTDLREILRAKDFSETQLMKVMQQAIWKKPKSHCFLDENQISENHKMVEIGG